jgi:hypothetical protein
MIAAGGIVPEHTKIRRNEQKTKTKTKLREQRTGINPFCFGQTLCRVMIISKNTSSSTAC